MTSTRQILANRRNAQRSTGPRTVAGKKRSSGNAYKHGLSLALHTDNATIDKIEHLIRQVAGPEASEDRIEAAIDFAIAHHEIGRVREVRNAMLSSMDLAHADPEDLKQVLSTNRYENRALTKRRRASARLRALVVS
jgi:hypothetical protein